LQSLTGIDQDAAAPGLVKARVDVDLADGVPFISDADLRPPSTRPG
jgi:hypothetical protein